MTDPPHTPRAHPKPVRLRGLLLRALLGLGAVAAFWFLGRSLGGYVPRFAEWVRGLGAWGPAVFILGYAGAAVAFVPGSLLTLAAGAIFGIVYGVAYVFMGAMLGSAAAFLVSRYVARSWVERRIAGDRRFAAIDGAIGGEGRKVVLLLRLSPIFPYNLLNYALGLTRVSFTDYLIGSLGILPGTMLYVYCGKVAGDVAALAGGAYSGPWLSRCLRSAWLRLLRSRLW